MLAGSVYLVLLSHTNIKGILLSSEWYFFLVCFLFWGLGLRVVIGFDKVFGFLFEFRASVDSG